MSITEPQQYKNIPQNILKSSYLINNIQIELINENHALLSLEGTHINFINLKKNISYATNKEIGPVSPYKIISDVVTKSGCDFDNNYVDTSQRINFITAQNMNVNETIQYCLNLGISEKDPPMYFITRILDNKCMLYNLCTSSDYLICEANKFLSIPTKEKKGNTDIANYVSHIETETPNRRSI